jgi:hypothetical protein
MHTLWLAWLVGSPLSWLCPFDCEAGGCALLAAASCQDGERRIALHKQERRLSAGARTGCRLLLTCSNPHQWFVLLFRQYKSRHPTDGGPTPIRQRCLQGHPAGEGGSGEGCGHMWRHLLESRQAARVAVAAGWEHLCLDIEWQCGCGFCFAQCCTCCQPPVAYARRCDCCTVHSQGCGASGEERKFRKVEIWQLELHATVIATEGPPTHCICKTTLPASSYGPQRVQYSHNVLTILIP